MRFKICGSVIAGRVNVYLLCGMSSETCYLLHRLWAVLHDMHASPSTERGPLCSQNYRCGCCLWQDCGEGRKVRPWHSDIDVYGGNYFNTALGSQVGMWRTWVLCCGSAPPCWPTLWPTRGRCCFGNTTWLFLRWHAISSAPSVSFSCIILHITYSTYVHVMQYNRYHVTNVHVRYR